MKRRVERPDSPGIAALTWTMMKLTRLLHVPQARPDRNRASCRIHKGGARATSPRLSEKPSAARIKVRLRPILSARGPERKLVAMFPTAWIVSSNPPWS